MPGLAIRYHQTALDAQLTNTCKLIFSENGTSTSSKVPSVTTTSWSAATAASPSVKANSARIEATATSAGTITHVKIVTSADLDVTTWLALPEPKALSSGDLIFFDVNGIQISSS